MLFRIGLMHIFILYNFTNVFVTFVMRYRITKGSSIGSSEVRNQTVLVVV